MKYYTLNLSTEADKIGHAFPQIQMMSAGYDYDAENSVYELAKSVLDFPQFIPNLNSFVVHKKSKLTDTLSTSLLSRSGLLISHKFKKVLLNHKISSFKVYPATVTYKSEVHQYYWIHLKPELLDLIDYTRSSFLVLKDYTHKIGRISITSLNSYYQEREKLKSNNPEKTISIMAEKISFTNLFPSELDFLKIGVFDNEFYISERLKSAIESNNITGCEIALAHNLDK